MTGLAGETRSITVEREMPFPPEKIWRALTQPHLVAEWLMKNDIDATVGQRFSFSSDWGGVDCEMLAVEPHERLSYSWNYAHEDPAYALESVVTFTLVLTATGTLLRMEQVGFRPDQKQAFHGAKAGWREHLANLEKVVAGLG
ncbi:SRPBCC domain-containing protein [Sphingosinicella sp. LHD-64]|uniref:SRPBCC family protein n=1 Tax=Sphingosinicella sp. LHD-64 TaxID=3072139 RepID=UPI00280E4078|nr:SRPBCC domain-containing protein [Sphingosinicella sp. LHD-64]MDQ8757563.1 SRPBCC domain-containing protein [Sphingosinicella sp. LHD-64]